MYQLHSRDIVIYIWVGCLVNNMYSFLIFFIGMFYDIILLNNAMHTNHI